MQSAVLLLAVILLLSIWAWMPLPWRQPLVALLAVLWVVGVQREGRGMGWVRVADWRATMAWALGTAVLSCAVLTPLLEPLVDRLTGTTADYGSYGALEGNVPAALRLLTYAWISAAIGEEIIFRGLLLGQLLALFGSRPPAAAAAILLGAVLFGLAHASQGLPGALLTGAAGLLLGAVFVLSRRNLPAVILAHGLIDTWAVAALYLGRV